VSRHGSVGSTLCFAACAGLLSNTVILLSCSAVGRAHLVLGHAMVGLTYAAVVMALGAVASALRRYMTGPIQRP
jgi:hypothetical protein